MGLFDNAVPGGNITKPLLIALGALLAGRMLSGGRAADDDAAQQGQIPPPPQRQAPTPNDQAAQGGGSGGGILGGGLGELLEKLQNQGQGRTVDSWVGKGDNQPVAPADLGKAIGGKLLSELSQRTGIPQDQLLDQLSKVLPGVVDQLTPNGSVPSNDQVAGHFGKSPW